MDLKFKEKRIEQTLTNIDISKSELTNDILRNK